MTKHHLNWYLVIPSLQPPPPGHRLSPASPWKSSEPGADTDWCPRAEQGWTPGDGVPSLLVFLRSDAREKAYLIYVLSSLWLVKLLPLFIIRRVLKRMTTGDLPADSRWIDFHEAYLREVISNIERSMYVNFLRSSLAARRNFTFGPEVLDSWPGSILILSSQDDALSRQSVAQLQARYLRAKPHLLEAGGHHAFLFFPEAYTAALKEFLDQVSHNPSQDYQRKEKA